MMDNSASRSYNRVLLKLSGEALRGSKDSIDPDIGMQIAGDIISVLRKDIQVAIVCGGGNIFRGISAEKFKIDRVPADMMGMLATMINGIALSEFIRAGGIEVGLMSALPVKGMIPEFSALEARRMLSQGKVVIFCGGTGHPYFSTDTAAALRALEINSDVLLKATKVDGVYDSDPINNPDAVLYRKLSYNEVIEKELRVMDITSITLCRDNSLPVRVFNLNVPGNLTRAVTGEQIGTLISEGDNHD